MRKRYITICLLIAVVLLCYPCQAYAFSRSLVTTSGTVRSMTYYKSGLLKTYKTVDPNNTAEEEAIWTYHFSYYKDGRVKKIKKEVVGTYYDVDEYGKEEDGGYEDTYIYTPVYKNKKLTKIKESIQYPTWTKDGINFTVKQTKNKYVTTRKYSANQAVLGKGLVTYNWKQTCSYIVKDGVIAKLVKKKKNLITGKTTEHVYKFTYYSNGLPKTTTFNGNTHKYSKDSFNYTSETFNDLSDSRKKQIKMQQSLLFNLDIEEEDSISSWFVK